jgi:hypothetical protein
MSEGWKLVPVEPIEAMLEAARALHDGSADNLKASYHQMHREDYRAMLAAAPEPPSPSPELREALDKARSTIAMLRSFVLCGDDLNSDDEARIEDALAAIRAQQGTR